MSLTDPIALPDAGTPVPNAEREPARAEGPDSLEHQAAAHEEVVVLDYGGQYSQLIARRVRECGVFSELLAPPRRRGGGRAPPAEGVILSGGPASVYADGAPPLDRALLELGVPVLGICYGMQLLARELGGQGGGRGGRRVRPLAAARR